MARRPGLARRSARPGSPLFGRPGVRPSDVAVGAGVHNGAVTQIVVAGGGIAGLQSVTALRARGYAGRVVMVTGESQAPYDRPPLSKQVLLNDERYDPSLPFDTEQLDVDLRLETMATGLSDGVLRTSSGDLPFDGLVLATGSAPIELPGTGPHTLRTLADARRLRAGLRPGARVLIVGAGWIGAEVATAAAARGCAVTVLERAEAPVAHALPSDLGARMISWYQEAGVRLRTGAVVTRADADGVQLADGSWVPADLVLVSVGVRPATEWLEGSGVSRHQEGNLAGGVGVDGTLRTSLPGVVAVGDTIARWSERFQARLRTEHWEDAMRGPAVAVTNLLRDLAAEPAHSAVPAEAADANYDPVPYVWSEQFGRMVQFAGYPPAGVRRVERGSDLAPSVFWLDERDRIVALLVVDLPKDFVQGRKLAAVGATVDPRRLADPATPVRATVASSET